MTIAEGEALPGATLMRVGADGPETVELGPLTAGRTVVIFGLPGAFTGTCTNAHVPSFVEAREALGEKGVDEVICVAVNDPFVMDAWTRHTGAGAGGITMLADPEGKLIRAMGLDFDAPPAGLIGRSKRFAMVVEDGTVRTLRIDENPGVAEATRGDAILATL